METYFVKQYKNLKFEKATEEKPGLRNAQIGAIHAIASYFTLQKNKAAIIVMPTGSGKTAVLMMTPYVLGSSKVLIVTPSVMVRSQITEDFRNLNTLCKATVFNGHTKKPKVYELQHNYSSNYYQTIIDSDVIIATPQCALSISEDDEVKKQFDIVLIDEAHHAPAKTWEQILINIGFAKHVLFTATPFRLDKKEIKGEMIYSYPLSMAYNDNIFGEIEYIPIEESPNKDFIIAKRSEQVFLSDRELGFDHYLMVRTNTKENAKELELLYSQETSLKLKRIDSSMTYSVIKKCLKELKDKLLDGIICVNMLGEGFDFPNMKIAAIHTPHKSLASTLQFIGRFARTNGENIGTAKFIAMNDEELLLENKALYTDDAIWQDIIIDLSEGRTKTEENTKAYFAMFRKSAGSSNGEEEISLHSIRPNCHAKIYKVSSFNIKANFPDICNVDDRIYVNEDDNTIIGIGNIHQPPKWATTDNILDINNLLYIVHYQKDVNLLYIYSQVKTEAIYNEIVKSFCNSAEKIPKYKMNRVLGELKEFEIFNSGMQNRFIESGESYRISAGSDVSEAIDPTTGKLYSAGHVFCKAQTNDNEITIGYSSGSKMWSSAYFTVPEYIKWCDFNGKKIENPDMKVKTNTNFDYIPIPTKLTEYPSNIFICDFSPKTYSFPPLLVNKDNTYNDILVDIKPLIREVKRDSIMIEFNHNDLTEIITCDIDGIYASIIPKIEVRLGREGIFLFDYLNEYPLTFKTTDDVMIQDNEYCKGNPDAIVYSSENIKGIDWDYYGTDRKVEVNDPTYHPSEVSIQTTLEQILRNDTENKFLIYDHSSSEMADFITIKEDEYVLNVTLFHVKKMTATNYNSSVDDIYEVTGQAIKSAIWLKSKPGFKSKVADRRRSGHCIFKVGSYDEFQKVFKQNKQLKGNIVIVQPSISKSVNMPDKIQEVLAAANYYILNSGKVKSLEIWGSF